MNETSKRFVIVDVGCIECGEQTEVVGVYDTEDDAKVAFDLAAKDRGIEEWQPRGGFLEFVGLSDKAASTYVGGCGYFAGGQHALELHVVPAQALATVAPPPATPGRDE